MITSMEVENLPNIHVDFQNHDDDGDLGEGYVSATVWKNGDGFDIGLNTGFDATDTMFCLDVRTAEALIFALLKAGAHLQLEPVPDIHDRIREMEGSY